MAERFELEALFVANLPVADKIIGGLARRHSLSADAADEFGAWAKLRIIEDDYAMLAKFRGESSLSTYLTVCLAMLYREYRVAEWGRWRPSAAARRHGELAVRLETMVRRDGVPIPQAGLTLRTSGKTTLGDRELAQLLADMPMRAPLRPVQSGELLTSIADASAADEFVIMEEEGAEADRARHALGAALAALPTEDQLIVRMRFMGSLSIADIARGLSIPQKPLYRRLERALGILRRSLEQAGISREDAQMLAGGSTWG